MKQKDKFVTVRVSVTEKRLIDDFMEMKKEQGNFEIGRQSAAIRFIIWNYLKDNKEFNEYVQKLHKENK